MTTVGYGDYCPKTNVGRFFSIIISLWGVFFVSLFVVALYNVFAFQDAEYRAYVLLNRLEIRNDLKNNAARMIQGLYLIRRAKREGITEYKLQMMTKEYKKNVLGLKQNIRLLISAHDNTTTNDRL
jgi:hypothetical protein